MSRIRLSILFCVTVLSFINVTAQPKNLNPFKSGDIVPNRELKVYQGSVVKNMHLYDLNKKLVLLDLWGVNCSSCIKSFPHMLELQKQFGSHIQIILVTLNSKQEVDNLWEKLKGHVPPTIIDAYKQLPKVLGDTALFLSFPKNSVPAHVWIDSAHKIKSISYGNSTTSAMIQDFISGKKVHFHDQIPRKIDFINPLSWLNSDTGFLSSLSCYSFILSRIEHAGGNDGQVTATIDSSTGKLIGLSTVNMKIANLYKMAYFKYRNPDMGILDNRIFLEVKDKGRFYLPKNVSENFDWYDTNQFCLSIKVPSSRAEMLYTSLQELLDNYFHYKSKLETRRVKCLVLKRISPEDKIRTKGGPPVYELSVTEENTDFIYKNQPFEALFSNLQTAVYETDPYIPFFNDTNYEGNIDITLPWSDDPGKISLEMVKKALNKYGLDIAQECRDLEMLVIADVP
jgi:thiol-disulfide isomerase/thioredoxin